METDQNTQIVLRKQLMQLLQVHKLSASELSRRAGVPKQTISDWLGGVPPRNVRALRNVARALGTSIEFLVFGEKDLQASGRDQAVRPLSPIAYPHDLSRLDQEWVIITEKGLVSYLSGALAGSLGMQPEAFQGRPFHELIHIDDIPSRWNGQDNTPRNFRLMSPRGEITMDLHQSMALHDTGLTIHHFQPTGSQPAETGAADVFDIRDLLNKVESVTRHPPYQTLAFASQEWQAKPIYICAQRVSLGRLLLMIIHELGRPSKGTGDPLPLDVMAYDRNFEIVFPMNQDARIQTQSKAWRGMMCLARTSGLGLRLSSSHIIIHGPRIFLSAPASH